MTGLAWNTQPAAVPAHHCEAWELDSTSVILLDAGHSLATELRARVMAKGLEVFIGPEATEIEDLPLVLVPYDSRHKPDVVRQLDRVARLFPTAPICYVYGFEGPSPDAAASHVRPRFGDSRALLDASGILFLSLLEMQHAA